MAEHEGSHVAEDSSRISDKRQRREPWHQQARNRYEAAIGHREGDVLHTVFFFSSRRRHTRCSRDWSSDVCSSDLSARPRRNGAWYAHTKLASLIAGGAYHAPLRRGRADNDRLSSQSRIIALLDRSEIGRASCRERG